MGGVDRLVGGIVDVEEQVAVLDAHHVRLELLMSIDSMNWSLVAVSVEGFDGTQRNAPRMRGRPEYCMSKFLGPASWDLDSSMSRRTLSQRTYSTGPTPNVPRSERIANHTYTSMARESWKKWNGAKVLLARWNGDG